eukprot:TRINITY_DN5417_c0_g1_i2.p1 TRINITY_DN5417_c0_g1~~TRINITY_DN5417_c0_g1_i2.p1  ORF type:complete len:435 (+),score=40.62 TRINITY_DN5417_c0_g1_i2:147-1451(+)
MKRRSSMRLLVFKHMLCGLSLSIAAIQEKHRTVFGSTWSDRTLNHSETPIGLHDLSNITSSTRQPDPLHQRFSRSSTILFFEPFNNAHQFTLSRDFFTASGYSGADEDYFGLVNASGSFRPGSPTFVNYTGMEGGYLAAQDVDVDEAGPRNVILQWTNIDITSYECFQLSGLFASQIAEAQGHNVEEDDYVHVDYSYDGINYFPFLHFEANNYTDLREVPLRPRWGYFYPDYDFNGEGDLKEPKLESFGQRYLAEKVNNGSNTQLHLRLDIQLMGRAEDIGIDSLMLSGGACTVTPGNASSNGDAHGEGGTESDMSGGAGSEADRTLLLAAAGAGGGLLVVLAVFVFLRHRESCCRGKRGRVTVSSAVAPLSSSPGTLPSASRSSRGPPPTAKSLKGSVSGETGRREQLVVRTLDGELYNIPGIIQEPQYEQLV